MVRQRNYEAHLSYRHGCHYSEPQFGSCFQSSFNGRHLQPAAAAPILARSTYCISRVQNKNGRLLYVRQMDSPLMWPERINTFVATPHQSAQAVVHILTAELEKSQSVPCEPVRTKFIARLGSRCLGTVLILLEEVTVYKVMAKNN